MNRSSAKLAERVIAWATVHGRHDLPWQQARTPYRVWLSEIMLQQTQVATVIPYFERFTARYPDVYSLAAASTDEVLHLWSGLGYYSRARNLHACARAVVDRHDGVFPDAVEGLCALPGIGRSTAGAIIALAGDRRAAILDGNVKRVLARYHAEPGWPGEAAVLKRLWQHAERHLPTQDYRAYTQAMMDLGATLCTRRKPRCEACPLVTDCAAHAADCAHAFPAPRPKRTLPQRETCFLIIEDAHGAVLLERRPPAGIWGGLWCFPEIADPTELAARTRDLGLEKVAEIEPLEPLSHGFTHFKLTIRPLRLRADAAPGQVQDSAGRCWYQPAAAPRIGLSAPVARLLKTLRARPV